MANLQESQEYTGFHSVVEPIIHHDGSLCLDKQYGKKAGDITHAQAKHLQSLMLSFEDKAKLLGVQVVGAVRFFTTPNGHPGSVTFHEVVRHAGPNVKQLLQTDKPDLGPLNSILRRVLTMHRLVFDSGWLISLDPPLPNFCLNHEDQVVYVDRMPPRQKLGNGEIYSDFPEPPSASRSFIESRFFSINQAPVIYAQMLRDTLGVIPAAAVREMVVEILGTEASRSVCLTDDQKAEVLRRADPRDVDSFRIIAGEKLGDKTTLERVFKLTHIGVGGILPSKLSTIQACQMLMEKD